MADYAAKELNPKRVATISDDFAFGHEQVAAFQHVFEGAGGKLHTLGFQESSCGC
jgi:branched-chain amino acid transport system substrate-binding protein